MEAILFPREMNSCKSSKCGNALRIYRIIAFFITEILFINFYFSDTKLYFAYLTHWGIILTTTYLLLVNLSYFLSFLDKPSCILYQIIWAFNWTITLAFWLYLFPREKFDNMFQIGLSHSVPLIFTLIDFSMNQISFIRIQFIFPMSSLLLYLFGDLLPITLEDGSIYAGITFHNKI